MYCRESWAHFKGRNQLVPRLHLVALVPRRVVPRRVVLDRLLAHRATPGVTHRIARRRVVHHRPARGAAHGVHAPALVHVRLRLNVPAKSVNLILCSLNYF